MTVCRAGLYLVLKLHATELLPNLNKGMQNIWNINKTLLREKERIVFGFWMLSIFSKVFSFSYLEVKDRVRALPEEGEVFFIDAGVTPVKFECKLLFFCKLSV